MMHNAFPPATTVATCDAQRAGTMPVANCASLSFAHFKAEADELANFATVIDLPEGSKAPEWVQLLPLGDIIPSPLDARKSFALKDAERVIAASQPFLRTMTIDYDHATDDGGSSRAAGWVKELSAKGPNGEPGIWGRVEWTEAGAKAVEGREYRFLSPSLYHDKTTREVRFIVRAALTNNPALVMKALASIQSEDQPLNEFLKKLAAMCGLDPATATEADVLAAIEAAVNNQAASADLANKDKQLCAIAKAAGHTVADTAKIDDTMVAAICKTIGDAGEAAALKDQLADAKVELITLRATKDAQTPEEIVDALAAKGLITPAAKDEALDLYKLSPTKFNAMVAKLEPSLLSTRVAPTKPAGKDSNGPLDDGAADVCAKFGIDPKKFAETDKELANMRETRQ